MRGAARPTARRRRTLALVGALGVLVVATLGGCAGRRFEGGAFHSPKGYRVALPGGAWVVDDASEADLVLRHRAAPAAVLVNAECGRAPGARTPEVLARHLFIGVRDRVVIERADTTVAGRPAAHAVVDGRADADGAPARIEVYVVKGERCIYDVVYAAPPAEFQRWAADFQRLVGSFVVE